MTVFGGYHSDQAMPGCIIHAERARSETQRHSTEQGICLSGTAEGEERQTDWDLNQNEHEMIIM